MLGVSPEVYRFFFLFSRSSMSEEDPSSSWAVRSETFQPGVFVTVDPTSETDQTLMNNLVMSNPRPAVQSYSNIAASGTITLSSESSC